MVSVTPVCHNNYVNSGQADSNWIEKDPVKMWYKEIKEQSFNNLETDDQVVATSGNTLH